jgi:hypothetical protein
MFDLAPALKSGGFFYFFFMHLPMALHLAGAGQPAHGLNAAFLAAGFAFLVERMLRIGISRITCSLF